MGNTPSTAIVSFSVCQYKCCKNLFYIDFLVLNILYLMNLLKIYLPTLLMMFDVFTILSFRYATRISIFSFRNTPCFWFFPVHSIFPRGATKGFFALIMPITVLLKSSYCSKISAISFSPDTFACLGYHIAEFTPVWNNSNQLMLWKIHKNHICSLIKRYW